MLPRAATPPAPQPVCPAAPSPGNMSHHASQAPVALPTGACKRHPPVLRAVRSQSPRGLRAIVTVSGNKRGGDGVRPSGGCLWPALIAKAI